MINLLNKTIAAVATPFGRGGIAVIRISGADAVKIAERMFRPAGAPRLSETAPRHAVYGNFMRGETSFDDGIAVYYAAPHSYTGEDVVELSCHGGIFLTQYALETALLCGASAAGPGEFTRRAFLNGKLGLTGAEAVADLIDAQSAEQLKLASAQSRGVLRNKLSALYDEFKTIVSDIYVSVDFPGEDLSGVTDSDIRNMLKTLIVKINALAGTYGTGHAVCRGIEACVVGKPNVGKSSLFNALAGEDRAIVTDTPGTTRDTVEAGVAAGKVLLRLWDTAGIRETSDKVEKIGVERSGAKIRDSELVIAVFDGSAPLDDGDADTANAITASVISGAGPEKAVIAVVNKSDLPCACADREEFYAQVAALLPKYSAVVPVSAATGMGIAELLKKIEEMYASGEIDYDTTAVITNARQYALIKNAEAAAVRALEALDCGFTADIAGIDLETAMEAIAEIDGRRVSEDIVDDIFSRFCVGK